MRRETSFQLLVILETSLTLSLNAKILTESMGRVTVRIKLLIVLCSARNRWATDELISTRIATFSGRLVSCSKNVTAPCSLLLSRIVKSDGERRSTYLPLWSVIVNTSGTSCTRACRVGTALCEVNDALAIADPAGFCALAVAAKPASEATINAADILLETSNFTKLNDWQTNVKSED